MRAGFGGPGTLLAVVLLIGVPAVQAQQIETRGGSCNDAPFGSDGGGITACMDYALRYDDMMAGIGIFGVTKDAKKAGKDPLEAKGRIMSWVGRQGDMGGYDYAVSGRIGIEGGTADDIARSLKETIHDLFGAGNAKLVSENDTKFLGGVSGWVRTEYDLGGPGPWAMSLDPYAHAALGLDSVEGGAGLMLVFQPPAETRGLAPLMPKTGAYAPAFGGDGFGIFAGVRGVAYEGLYEDFAEPFLAEAGITAQVTLWDFAVIGAAASCTTPPYETT